MSTDKFKRIILIENEVDLIHVKGILENGDTVTFVDQNRNGKYELVSDLK